MRKEQVKKNPRGASMTPKQDDNTPKSLELSEGQLEVHFRRLNLAHTRRIYKEVAVRAEKESWSYRDFLALCSPKKSLVASRRDCSASRGAHTSRSSRPLKSSTSLYSRRSGNLSSAPTSGSTSSPRGARSSCTARPVEGKLISRSPSPTAPSRTASRLSSPPPPNSSRPLERQQARTSPRIADNLHAPSRPRHR